MSTQESTAPAPAATAAWWRPPETIPAAPLLGRLTRLAVAPMARRLGIRVALPDGRVLGRPDPRAPLMRLHDPEALYRRFGALGPIGFGESYQAGEWDADDLTALLSTVAGHLRAMAPRPVLWLTRLQADRRRPPATRNTAGVAARNVRHHYDLPSELFELFLDETMTYSAAIFPTGADGRPLADEAGLADAQRRKIDRLLDLARVGPGTQLLETGTGWGALAVAAARRGADVHTVTLSVNQCREARRRAAEAGVADRVRVELCDYRDIRPRGAGGYDAVVSAEMLEGVGHDFWPDYFATIDLLLVPGGRAAIQTITMRHDDMLATRSKDTWIHRYIFPGGLIPSVPAVEAACRRHTRLRVHRAGSYGPHYAATLRLWRERFDRHAAEVDALGLDRVFRRTWHLYLAYSEAGFAAGHLDVEHLLLDRAS
ncbi:class I SAM-dependent methyltransferase [Dactylosporangium sucinum]|uniref:Cyclopropane-fatty-acyl-phospholipid synthase n=1 Tax=Dactylosporangium sucinum TaxID=1424081 RepID=A0A917X8G7_9ACTN|nr:cyclopropane-fatty-acyl-phospholipid synthase family protein [Dactylosporangium sucinum]GGM89551.1 cyclopropane-fatty-acyl-phospholipid synthase [Dactylosporangium sucinum]